MMDPTGNAFAPALAAASGPAAMPTNTIGELGSDAFLELLVAQLRYQDPMAPSDGAAMLQQTAQFTQVETLKQVASLQQQLMGLQQTAIASGLIGRQVDVVTDEGQPLRGVVDAVRFTDAGPRLVIGDTTVPLENAREIQA